MFVIRDGGAGILWVARLASKTWSAIIGADVPLDDVTTLRCRACLPLLVRRDAKAAFTAGNQGYTCLTATTQQIY